MASKQGVKSKRFGTKCANSPSSSTTSSSKQFQEASCDGPSSPASSSARSKPQQQQQQQQRQRFYPEAAAPLDAQRAKENVTVTVRFRPLK